MKNYVVANGQTDIERFQNEENAVIVKWDSESKTIETYSRGYPEPMYVGQDMEKARESLELCSRDWEELLAADVEYLEEI